MEQRIVKYQTQSSALLERAKEFTIKNEEQLNESSDKIKEIKHIEKIVKTEKEEYTKPAREIIKNANNKFNPIIEVCNQVEKILKEKASQFILAQNEKSEEKRRKIEEKAQSGKMKEETAVKKLSEVDDVKAKTESSSLRVSTRKVVEIVDETKIPRRFMDPNLKEIRVQLLAGNKVAGARLVEKPVISSI